MTPSIRVSLTTEEAEALLWIKGTANPKPDPTVALRARGKLTSKLLADVDYAPPWLRRARAEHSQASADE